MSSPPEATPPTEGAGRALLVHDDELDGYTEQSDECGVGVVQPDDQMESVRSLSSDPQPDLGALVLDCPSSPVENSETLEETLEDIASISGILPGVDTNISWRALSRPHATSHLVSLASDTPTRRTLVSVILAVFNEAPFIEATVNSLLDQRGADLDLEILAIDGRSTDGTTEILERMATRDSRIRHLLNPRRITPAAFNIGLGEARGDFVAVFGAHALYDRDYLATCLREMQVHGVVGCGGRLMTSPATGSLQARLVAWAMSHPFGSSSRSVRTQPEGFSDTIPFAVFVKSALLDAGGFDERLVRNQDNDMSEKLLMRGGRFYLTWKTRAVYFAKALLASFAHHAFKCGYWNVVSLRRNPRSMRVRHFVPLAFVLALSLSCALALVSPWEAEWWRSAAAPLAGLLALYGGAGLVSGIQVALSQRSLAPLLLPPVFFVFHVSYGMGSLSAMLAGLTLLGKRVEGRVPARV